jgi:hypothetical protein
MDVIGNFLKECCVQREGATIRIRELFKAYRTGARRTTNTLAASGFCSCGSRRWALRRGASLTPTPCSTHIFPALVFASQSPYPGRQNVIYSRNVRRNGYF